jgi:hypothetical protein
MEFVILIGAVMSFAAWVALMALAINVSGLRADQARHHREHLAMLKWLAEREDEE